MPTKSPQNWASPIQWEQAQEHLLKVNSGLLNAVNVVCFWHLDRWQAMLEVYLREFSRVMLMPKMEICHRKLELTLVGVGFPCSLVLKGLHANWRRQEFRRVHSRGVSQGNQFGKLNSNLFRGHVAPTITPRTGGACNNDDNNNDGQHDLTVSNLMAQRAINFA